VINVGTFTYYEEPELFFGYGQKTAHPKDGLLLFGPEHNPQKGGNLRVGVVATKDGLGRYKRWVKGINGPVLPKLADNPNHTVFPGFEAVFGVKWNVDPLAFIEISSIRIHNALFQKDRYQAIHDTVLLYAEPISKFITEQSETPVDVWFVIIPEDIYKLGRPESRVGKADALESSLAMNKKTADRIRNQPSLFAEDNAAAEVYGFDLNFHNQLKARLLKDRAAIQVVRETTLTPEDFTNAAGYPLRRLQDPATLAWNLCSTAFFKSGGKPWKLATPRPGVCYVGIVFKQDLTGGGVGNACCGAQMFLDSGDGVVFRGAVGPWYSVDRGEFHLTREKAKEMLSLVINAYKQDHGRYPAELFIHGKTYFNEDEWLGFKEVLPETTTLTCVRIRREFGLKLYRPGRNNVPRGLALKAAPNRGYLVSAGYISRLQTYPGREVPNPLSIQVTHGHMDIDIVMQDVLALTKLNFNACIYSDGLPVTLRFADSVGEILTAMPQSSESIIPPLPFRYYI
jgi:hypothetical protein